MEVELVSLARRIAEALERMAPPPPAPINFSMADAFMWSAESEHPIPVDDVAYTPLELLLGIDHVRDILLANTRQFAEGLPANNALLWGARGMGKSSLVKAIHAKLNEERTRAIGLVEIHREDIDSLPKLLAVLRASTRRFIVFCDDLSFSQEETSYKSLKAILEGGLAGRPENVIFYATSNRRHLMARDMIDNEKSTAIHPSEAVEEKVSLSDRFGLWLGFHTCTEATYLEMVDGYAKAFALNISTDKLHAEAIEWARTRGALSGRVAWQYIHDVAGRLGVQLSQR